MMHCNVFQVAYLPRKETGFSKFVPMKLRSETLPSNNREEVFHFKSDMITS